MRYSDMVFSILIWQIMRSKTLMHTVFRQDVVSTYKTADHTFGNFHAVPHLVPHLTYVARLKKLRNACIYFKNGIETPRCNVTVDRTAILK